MGNSVDIYTRTGSGIGRLTAELARASKASTYRVGADTSFFRAGLQSTLGLPGFMEIIIGFTDLKEIGEAGTFEGTALAHHEYEISIEFMAVQGMASLEGKNELGLRIFEMFSELGYPMTYVDLSERVSADFAPRKGLRRFSPPVELDDACPAALPEGPGGTGLVPSRTGPTAGTGSCSVFLTEGLMAACAAPDGIPTAPLGVLDDRLSDAETIGEVVSSSFSSLFTGTQTPLSAEDIADTLRVFTGSPGSDRAAPVKRFRLITSGREMTVCAEPGIPHRGEQAGRADAPALEGDIVHRGPLPGSDTELGRLMKSLREIRTSGTTARHERRKRSRRTESSC
ncbi:hypothetical protein ACQEU5_07355 [Marinactinospora thermotolerans]|uniref:hypothetical protein n=1 Tax=Marinactinospora thermotolerans TaxID=531310 RepID=UPI003D8D6469